MTIAASPVPSSQRVRATPYARRLAREQNLPLSGIAGSGPNGRIIGDDLINFKQAEIAQQLAPTVSAPVPANASSRISESPKPAVPVAAAPSPVVTTAPSAIVARVDFAPLEALLVQIAELRPDVSCEDICLKAAAVASEALTSVAPDKALVLLAAPNKRQRLDELADASLSTIAKMRQQADSSGEAPLAVSFLGRAGIRPVAARLIGDGVARLVVGAGEKDGSAECLLSYDPSRVGDAEAEEFLATFKDLVETPFRLLV